MSRTVDRRAVPRPLSAHLASALTLWMSSGSAEARGRSGIEDRLLPGDGPARADKFLRGLQAYREHPYRRQASRVPVLWRGGTTRLLDYGRGRGGIPVLVIPSLINRFYVLDLLRERTFLRYLAAQGFRPLLVDWAAPGPAERRFGLDDYITLRLEPAFDAVRQRHPGPLGIIGYCMGGLLALALALRRPSGSGAVALLATPWDFHAEGDAPARLLAAVMQLMLAAPGHQDELSVDAIQALFWALDPFLAERKFVRFGGLDPHSADATAFVALEDWINDGVPLAAGVAHNCARDWYDSNATMRGAWKVGGEPVRPAALACPALVVVPSRDRIVPPRSAAALTPLLPNAIEMRPDFGHIGMMASATAPDAVWRGVAEWLRATLRA